ncbi:MAG: HlyD family efflux transporter periplasmic adaptor subunit [Clostridia bacterium]|nr:HlyD family efflux transporter periplasmic adaptor subunit [Clostridia bacterium]
MKRICLILTLLSLLFALPAHGETKKVMYEGKVTAVGVKEIDSPAAGILESLLMEAGMTVEAGEELGCVGAIRVYAETDASISGLFVSEGESVSKEAFYLEPREKYTLKASAYYAFERDDNRFVHPGETVHLCCVKDSSHLGIGRVTSVDGDEFTIVTSHGALYLGEAVNVFRKNDYHYSSRIGRATVYRSDLLPVAIDGTITKLYVEEGDRVEKGEALLEYVQGENTDGSIISKESGIVLAVYKSAGDSVAEGEKIAEICTMDMLKMTIAVPETEINGISAGDTGYAVFASDPEQTRVTLTVDAVLAVSSGEEGEAEYEVHLTIEDNGLYRIGQNADVYL